MPFWRMMLAAVGVQLVGLGAAGALAGLGGVGVFGPFWSGWLDLVNSLAPIWFLLCLAGSAGVGLALGPRRARTAVLAVGAAAMIVAGVPVMAEVAAGWLGPRAARSPDGALKVLTFNAFDYSFMPSQGVEMILSSGADVVAVQETASIRPFLPQMRSVYPFQSPCEDKACSVIILAKRQPRALSVEYLPGSLLGPLPEGSGPGAGDVVVARIDFTAPDGRPATLISTHLNWPVPPTNYQLQQSVLEHYVAGLPKDRLILVGDFNTTPWTFAMRRQDAALRPLRRLTRALPTWPAYVPRLYIPLPVQFLPIDHIYVGRGWRPARLARLAHAASDHLPVEVELSPTRPRS